MSTNENTEGQRLAQVGDVLIGDSRWIVAGSDSSDRWTIGHGGRWQLQTRSDRSRDGANFVVVRTAMTGGGTGHGPGDIYPDGYEVTVKRLVGDGTYDPNGEELVFFQTGCFNCMIPNPRFAERRMRMVVDFVSEATP